MKEKTSPTQRALNLWAVVLIAWSIYRATFKTDLPVWFDEFIAKPALFVLPVLWFIRKVEKKAPFKSMDLRLKTLPTDLILGGIVGLIFLLIGYIGWVLRMGQTSIPMLPVAPLIFIVLTDLATSFSEEVLSRGFLLKRLFQESHNWITSIGISSVLFFVLHIPILFTATQVNGAILMQVMVTDIMLSIAISLLYLERKSLALAIIIHLFYALSMSLFL